MLGPPSGWPVEQFVYFITAQGSLATGLAVAPMFAMLKHGYEAWNSNHALQRDVSADGMAWSFLGVGLLLWGGMFYYHRAIPVEFMAVALAFYIIGLGTSIALLLLRHSFWLNTNCKKRWVKALDFPYLLFGFGGLVRVLNSAPTTIEKIVWLDTAGILFIAAALSFRLAKSIIEVVFEPWQ